MRLFLCYNTYMIYRIDINDFDEVYELFENSFPVAELRPYNKMKDFFKEGKLIIYAIKESDLIVMGLLCWEFHDFIFLENFAVHPKYRGKGIGTITLQEIKKKYNKLIVLEVEEPYDLISKKRIGFYERNEFNLSEYGYNQPPLNPCKNTIPLRIMSTPYLINKHEFETIKLNIFKEVYQKNLE